jgi:uncharacterized membrane protein
MVMDLMKTGTRSLLHAGIGFGVVYGLTGSAAIASGVALIEPCVAGFAFLLHDRAWKALEAAGIPLCQPMMGIGEDHRDGFTVSGKR